MITVLIAWFLSGIVLAPYAYLRYLHLRRPTAPIYSRIITIVSALVLPPVTIGKIFYEDYKAGRIAKSFKTKYE